MTTARLTLVASRGGADRGKPKIKDKCPCCSRPIRGVVSAHAGVELTPDGGFRQALHAQSGDLVPLLLACHILVGEILERIAVAG